MRRLLTAVLVVGTACILSVAPVHAGPITGAFSIEGNFLAVDAFGEIVALDDATSLDFIAETGSEPTPGEAGQFDVTQASGDFAFLEGDTGLIADFTFSGPGSDEFPTTPVSMFQSIGGLTFDLLSVTVAFQEFGFLELNGTGTFNLGGYSPTPGTFTLTAQEEGQTFTFSAGQKATPTSVPEPASLLLFGAGVSTVGFGWRRRRTLVR
jgi:hypothetical protein